MAYNKKPPPLPKKPDTVYVFRAMYPYTAQREDELSFEEGDYLYVSDISKKDGWWQATCGGVSGLIPSNYVEENTESVSCPLHEAAKRGNIEFLEECLRNNVSVSDRDKAGCVPLHWAAHCGSTEALNILLQQPNCRLDVQNKLGDTPLHSAAWKGRTEIVKILLDKGALFDLRNKDNKTPLDLASNVEIKAMLSRKVKPPSEQSIEDYGGESDSD